MQRFTTEERIQIVQIYYENGRSITNTIRRLRVVFHQNHIPSNTAIRNLMAKFERTGSVLDVKSPLRPRNVRSVENIAMVNESVTESPKTSIRHRSQQLAISRSSLQRILTNDLRLHAYKIQLTQELKPRDHHHRRIFANWILEQTEFDDEFCKRIIFSDEAHFHLGVYVNKQNCRIWGRENPREINEKPMHPLRVTVWCGFSANGVIGPYFFENENGEAETVNGERYRQMLNNFLWPRLEDMDLNNLYFQQDGATCHTARETLNLLQEKFPRRVISRNGDVNWPARSCDITPLDFFLWGFLKDQVYKNNPQTIDELKNNIRGAIGEINLHMCDKVIENFKKRIAVCNRSHGGHLSDILFHI